MEIILEGMPKVSLNAWYSSNHWSKRSKIKNTYAWLIKSRVKGQFQKDKKYEVDYLFEFKKNPLDASNCVAMVKLTEDLLFEDDKWDIVTKISIKSRKAKKDRIIINVKEI